MMFRPSRSRLILTTALAGGLVFPTFAVAQTANGTLPNASDASVIAGSATITGGGPTPGSTLDVALNSGTSVIDWYHFDVPATDTARFVNSAGVPLAAVLNRVRVGGPVAVAAPSNLAGTITAPGVELWIQNGEGFIFGSNLSVNSAGFVATVGEITLTDFLDGTDVIRAVAPAGSTRSITGGGAGTRILTNGGRFALIAPAIAVTGTFDAGTGSAAFVTATDVTMNLVSGSPLSLTVDGGTSLGGASQVVGGTVNGAEAYFVLASANTVVDAILDVGASVRATGAVATARGVVLTAGNPAVAAPGVTLAGGAATGGSGSIRSSGTIDATGAGQTVVVRAAGDIAATGKLTSAGGITTDSATLSLADAAAGTGITLKATGATGLGSVTSVGGPVTVTSGGALTGIGAAAGDLAAGGALAVTATGAIALDALSGTTVTVAGPSLTVGSVAARAGDVALVANAGGASVGAATASNDVLVTATGVASVAGAVTAGRDYIVSGASVRLGDDADSEIQQAARFADVTATTGSITGGAGLTLTGDGAGAGLGNAVTLDAANGAITLPGSVVQGGPARTSDVALRFAAGTPLVLGDVSARAIGRTDAANAPVVPLAHDAAITLRNISVTTPLSLTTTAGGITTGTIAAGDVTLTAAGAGNVTTASIVSSGAIKLAATGLTTGDVTAATTLDVTATGAITGGIFFGNSPTIVGGRAQLTAIVARNGAVDARTTAGRLDIGGNVAGADVSLRTAGGAASALTVGNVTASGTATLQSSGDIQFNRVDAAGTVSVSGVGAVGTGNLTSTAGDVAVTTGGAATLGAVSGNAASISAASIAATTVTARTGAVSLSATGGGLTTTSVNAVGNITLNASGAITAPSTTSSAGSVGITAGGAATLGTATGAGVTATAQSIAATSVVGRTSGVMLTASGGPLTLGSVRTDGGNAVLTSNTGLVSIADSSTIAGDLTIAGNAVSLGDDPAAETISAAGTIGVTARTGDIVGGAGLTLRSDSAGAGARNLYLDATAGNIAFAPDSLIQGGPDRQSTIGLRAGGGAIALGTASANRIGGITGVLDIAGITARDFRATGPLQLRQAFAVTGTGVGAISVADVTVTDAGAGIALTGVAHPITAAALVAPGAIAVDTGGTVTIASAASSTVGVTVRGGSVGLGTASAATALELRSTTGALSLGNGTAGTTASLTAAGPLTVMTTLTGATGATATATGAATIGMIRSTGGAVAVDAASAAITTAAAAMSLAVDARSGAITLAAGTAGTTARLTASGDVTASTGLTSGGTATVGGANLRLGNVAATSGNILLTGTGEVTGIGTGRANLSAGGAGNDVTVTAGGLVRLGDATAADAVTVRGTAIDATATTATGGLLDLNATAGTLTLGTGTAGAAATLRSTGAATLGTLTATGGASIDAAGAATLGAITAGPSLTIRATDAIITGTQRAASVSVVNRTPANALRLGDGTAADGFRLSQAEVGFIDANALTLDAGTGAVEVGALALGAAAGRTSVNVLTTGRIDVRGTVTGGGTGRSFRFGGTAANVADRASSIQIATTANGGGRLLFSTADLELRGTRIAQGQSAGFLDALGPLSPTDVAGRFVSNAGSSLYSASQGGVAYDAAATTILSANRLTVRFTDYALFQNTGLLGENSGAVIGAASGPALNFIANGATAGSGALAIFGSVGGIGGIATALLGPSAIGANDVDLRSARVNGCLLGSGAGCLSNVVSIPILSIFDASRTQILRAADNLAVPFDPVVGTNNEALFSGVSSIDAPPEDLPPAPACPEGSIDAACPPKETVK